MERREEEQEFAPTRNPPTKLDLHPPHRENGPVVGLRTPATRRRRQKRRMVAAEEDRKKLI
jgi:hypothetical protein